MPGNPISAWEYDGKVFRTESDVLDYQAQEALEAECLAQGGNPELNKKFFKNPKRIYNLLKGVYGDS